MSKQGLIKCIALFERNNQVGTFLSEIKKHGLSNQIDIRPLVVNSEADVSNPWGEDAGEVRHIATMWGTVPSLLKLLESSPKIDWIHSMTAGVDKLMDHRLDGHNFKLTNSKGVFSSDLAEMVMLAVLYFEKNVVKWKKYQEQKLWKQEDVAMLQGKKVLVVGFGDIGGQCGKKLKLGLDMKVVGLKRDPKTVEDRYKQIADKVCGMEELDAEIPSADYIVSCLPLVKDTKGYWTLEHFKKMKPSAIFINIGRGQNVVEKDLVIALQQGIIAGSYLDVFEVEPLPQESPLWKMENVLMTPHCADFRDNTWENMVKTYVENLDRYVKGEALKTLVDRSKGY